MGFWNHSGKPEFPRYALCAGCVTILCINGLDFVNILLMFKKIYINERSHVDILTMSLSFVGNVISLINVLGISSFSVF